MAEAPLELSRKEARRLFLNQQGLLRPASFGRGADAVVRAIEQIGWVQIDTLSVVERAHHHILASRIPGYRAEWLEDVQQAGESRQVFEYWSHAAAYLPFRDYRYYRYVMASQLKRQRKVNAKQAAEVRQRLLAEGPLQVRDFETPRNRKAQGWWDWSPAKVTLELMFYMGDLTVVGRKGFQKIYDLTEHALPAGQSLEPPDADEWAQFHTTMMIRGLGFATPQEITYMRTGTRKQLPAAVYNRIPLLAEEMRAAGQLRAIDVAGTRYFGLPGDPEIPRPGRRRVTFLSPFDNLVINRKRLQSVFDFNYTLECYVPEAKRAFGYFALPILFGDALIGRMDCKAERKDRHLAVHRISLENANLPRSDPQLLPALARGLTQFAAANACDTIAVAAAEPASLRRELARALASN
jgi:uncharacterized protein YcaQ